MGKEQESSPGAVFVTKLFIVYIPLGSCDFTLPKCGQREACTAIPCCWELHGEPKVSKSGWRDRLVGLKGWGNGGIGGSRGASGGSVLGGFLVTAGGGNRIALGLGWTAELSQPWDYATKTCRIQEIKVNSFLVWVNPFLI